jgi:hypothetical protein
MKIGVIHLVREENGELPIQDFIESYKKFSSGLPHEVVFIMKDYSNFEVLRTHKRLLDSICSEIIVIDQNIGRDIGAYFFAIENLNYDYFCFLNSFTIISHGNWLKHLFEPLLSPEVGIVGFSGSYESIASSSLLKFFFNPEKSKRYNFFDIKTFFRTLKHYPLYPNPHIRTNGFIASRRLLLSVVWPNDFYEKEPLHQFESGRTGLSSQIKKRGLSLVLVDKSGNRYPDKFWRGMKGFRIKLQEDLLFSDNRTLEFLKASKEERKWLSLTSWGRPFYGD